MGNIFLSNSQTEQMSLEAEVAVEVEVEVEAEVEVEVEVEIEAPEVEIEIEVEVEVPEVEVEIGFEVEVPEVEIEIEIEAPQVEIEIEIEAPELEIEVEIEVPDVEVGMNVEVDLNAPLTLEVGGGVADSKMAQMGAAKMGGMTQFCAFLAWFTFMMGIVVCSLFSVWATGEKAYWLGWVIFAVIAACSVGGIIFCFCSAGKRNTADIRAEVNISA